MLLKVHLLSNHSLCSNGQPENWGCITTQTACFPFTQTGRLRSRGKNEDSISSNPSAWLTITEGGGGTWQLDEQSLSSAIKQNSSYLTVLLQNVHPFAIQQAYRKRRYKRMITQLRKKWNFPYNFPFPLDHVVGSWTKPQVKNKPWQGCFVKHSQMTVDLTEGLSVILAVVLPLQPHTDQCVARAKFTSEVPSVTESANTVLPLDCFLKLGLVKVGL